MASCATSNEKHFVQRLNRFFKRWLANRYSLLVEKQSDNSDQMALSWHYLVLYGIINKTLVYEAYTVDFV